MSGFEIAGMLLGAVPLALEAYDRSGRVFEVYYVFKQYPRELRIIEDKISAQRTIFRNNACNLLNVITKDPHKVQEIMNQPSAFSDRSSLVLAEFHQHQTDALNESFTSCHRTAEHIRKTLELLCSQFKTFHVEMGDKDEKASASEWLRHVGTRFKLGLNKPRIKSTIAELRETNQDFGLITEQISRTLKESMTDNKLDKIPGRRPAGGLNILNRYHKVRYASNALYSSLQVGWLCSAHKSHVFDIRIIDRESNERGGKKKTALPSYVTCDLAITHDGSTLVPKGPLRIEIEQACESDDDDVDTSQQSSKNSENIRQLTSVLEPNASGLSTASTKTSTVTTKKVRQLFKDFRTSSPQQQPGSSQSPAPQVSRITEALAEVGIETTEAREKVSPLVTDLALVDDLCRRCQEATINCIGRSLLGSWTGPHAKWFCVPPAPQSTSRSLSDIISWVSEEPIMRSMSRPLRFKLASDLAEGIMQFYSTPWLASTNLGQHVRYIKGQGSSDAMSIPYGGPYFMARLEGTARSRGKNVHRVFYHDSKSPQFTEARNQLLFSFGILLLEIGYWRPWQELRQTVKGSSIGGQVPGQPSDYRAAEKLAQLLINQMGPAYPKIIRKCLGCDFGLGETDLDNEDLQRRFVVDVVSGLQQLEQHLKEAELLTMTATF